VKQHTEASMSISLDDDLGESPAFHLLAFKSFYYTNALHPRPRSEGSGTILAPGPDL
jgi:hypothetical protein